MLREYRMLKNKWREWRSDTSGGSNNNDNHHIHNDLLMLYTIHSIDAMYDGVSLSLSLSLSLLELRSIHKLLRLVRAQTHLYIFHIFRFDGWMGSIIVVLHIRARCDRVLCRSVAAVRDRLAFICLRVCVCLCVLRLRTTVRPTDRPTDQPNHIQNEWMEKPIVMCATRRDVSAFASGLRSGYCSIPTLLYYT